MRVGNPGTHMNAGIKRRIVVVDDHESVADMLTYVFRPDQRYEIVGRAQTGLQALEVCVRLRPDLVILDLMLPELCGAEVLRRLHLLIPGVRVLVYSGAVSRPVILDALRAQPAGYVDKMDSLETLREAVSVVLSGGGFFSQSAAIFLKESRMPSDAEDGLTNREREVLQLVAEGKSSKEISQRLGLSSKTVENHRLRLMQKIHVREIASLTRYAVRHGIVSL